MVFTSNHSKHILEQQTSIFQRWYTVTYAIFRSPMHQKGLKGYIYLSIVYIDELGFIKKKKMLQLLWCKIWQNTVSVILFYMVFFLLFFYSGKYTVCPSTLVYSYDMTTCQRTCHSMGQNDYTCSIDIAPVDGCGCEVGTYMNENGMCVTSDNCPCYDSNTVLQPGEIISKGGTTW